jgi:hypothetical protein
MRTRIVLLALAVLFCLPAAAQAQNSVQLEAVIVQLWPEFDRPSMLVIYDLRVSAETRLPTEVTVRIPAGAELLAVARDEAGTLVNWPHNVGEVQGDWQPITFTVSDLASYWVEFYDPLDLDGVSRAYRYLWPGDYPVGSFVVHLQQPVGASNVQGSPPLGRSSLGPYELLYHSIEPVSLNAGQVFELQVSYEKSSDALSAAGLPVQPGGDLGGMSTPTLPMENVLPWALGLLGAFLIVGGIIYFWQSGRAGSSSPRKRHRPARADRQAASAQIYCHECGKRAQPGDRFCRTCGTRLRRSPE